MGHRTSHMESEDVSPVKSHTYTRTHPNQTQLALMVYTHTYMHAQCVESTADGSNLR